MTTTTAHRWAPTAVALSTIVWVLAVLALVWRWFGIGLESLADQQTYSGTHEVELGHRAVVAQLQLIGVAVGGPALIAVGAFAGRMFRAGSVYLTLAVVLGALGAPLAANAYRRLPPPPAPPAPSVCQVHSGSGDRCPGG